MCPGLLALIAIGSIPLEAARSGVRDRGEECGSNCVIKEVHNRSYSWCESNVNKYCITAILQNMMFWFLMFFLQQKFHYLVKIIEITTYFLSRIKN